MEFLEGGTLARKLGHKPQAPRDAATIVEALARAVQHSHAHGVVHRDLKPANILLAADGTPKVVDFGLARQSEAGMGTRTGDLIGTPSYMAPEQAAGRSHRSGPAGDVYALGAILYECLTGRPPFKGSSVVETLEQVLSQPVTPPRQVEPTVPPDLEAVCLKCLSKEPANRYAAAGDLADDLRRYLDGRPVLARPVGRMGQVAAWCRRNRGAAIAIAALAVYSIVVTCFWLRS
jgi:serine/threonine protein kinase